MVKISGVKIDGQEQQDLLHKLETTTFERAYRETYIDIKPTNFVDKCKRCWAQVWLHTFGRSDWMAVNIAGADEATLKAERAAIKEYRTQRDNLITELAKTPIKNASTAELMKGVAEPLTSEKDPKNARLRQSEHTEDTVIPAFYKALSARVVSLNETASVDQAKLYKAGFADVSAKIAEHNSIKGLAYISTKWIMPVEGISKGTARAGLAASISVDDLATKGKDAIAGALDLYIKTFGLTDEEDVTTLAQEVYDEVVELHGKQCQNQLEIRQADNYVEKEVEHLETELNSKLANAKDKLMDFLATSTSNTTKARISKAKTQRKSKNREALKNSMDVLKNNKKTQAELNKNIKSIQEQLDTCKIDTQARVDQEIENLEMFTPKYGFSSIPVYQIVQSLNLDKASDDTSVEGTKEPKKSKVPAGGHRVIFDDTDFDFTQGLERPINGKTLLSKMQALKSRQRQVQSRRRNNEFTFSSPKYSPLNTGTVVDYTFTSADNSDPVVNLEDQPTPEMLQEF